MRRLAVETAEQAEAGGGIVAGLTCQNIDHTAESPGAVECRPGPLDHLNPFDLLQWHRVPLDIAQVRRQQWESVNQHQDTAAYSAAVTARPANIELTADLANTRHVAQGFRKGEGIVITDALGVGDGNAYRRCGESLRPPQRRHDHARQGNGASGEGCNLHQPVCRKIAEGVRTVADV